MSRLSEGSSSFLKKRTKKLLILGARAGRNAHARVQKFFASFFQKRSAFFLTEDQVRKRLLRKGARATAEPPAGFAATVGVCPAAALAPA
jgi:hypothetical protein